MRFRQKQRRLMFAINASDQDMDALALSLTNV